MKNKMKPTIGLEIHVELKTKSKMFCSCNTEHFRIKPNTHTCPTCLGLPGALPVPNKLAIEWTQMIGLALDSKINLSSKFDRKHYFYPDLPKGYQISQYDQPFCLGGHLKTSFGKVRITRVHLEEDTGKLIHKKVKGKEVSLVDFNRCGVALVEIVTEPDIKSGAQAKEFAQKLQQILRYMEVSDCDMEKGSMRLEANISLGDNLGYKVEVKNLNSFKFVSRAIDYELERQRVLLEKGITPRQETRGWNEKEYKTITQRYKETAADYRYFPEPDIPPFKFSEKYVDSIKKLIPELPDSAVDRLVRKYGVRQDYAGLATVSRELASFTERALEIGVSEKIKVGDVVGVIINQKVNIKNTTPKKLIQSIKKKKTLVISDKKELQNLAKNAIRSLPKAVEDYKSGKTSAKSAIIGKVMQLSGGKADPKITKNLIDSILNKE